MREGIRLVDINGDGRSDLVYVYEDSHTDIFINNRGSKGDGPRLKPVWHKVPKGHLGRTKRGVEHVKFGRVHGTGRADYISIEENSKNEGNAVKYDYKFAIWKNTGSGGAKPRGNGVRYCGMFFFFLLWLLTSFL